MRISAENNSTNAEPRSDATTRPFRPAKLFRGDRDTPTRARGPPSKFLLAESRSLPQAPGIDRVRYRLAIQDDVASFNDARGGGATSTPIALKLGLHAGPCISVTTGDVLDYFGATVNIAARLEHQCRGGEVVVSEAVAQDAEVAGALADRMQIEETATLRGVRAPVRFVRIAIGANDSCVRRAP
jgi:class 3 adenylate cyclase